MSDFFTGIKNKFVNRETVLYAIFGALTTLENIVLFRLLLMTSLEYKAANLITLIVTKITAYICNKNFVFRSKCSNFIELLKEIIRFIVARGATLLIDYFGLIAMVEIFGFDKFPSKVFLTVLVIVLNYIIGKKAVFKKS